MRSAALILALWLGALAPAVAQEAEPEALPEGDGVDEGMDLIERGAEQFLRGLMDEIRPRLERIEPELRGLADDLAPMFAELARLIDEIDAYHPPERLPNGDIILRRKREADPPAPEADPLAPPEDGQIDI